MAAPNPLLRWFLGHAFSPYHFTPSELKDKVSPPATHGSARYYVEKLFHSPIFGTPLQRRRAMLYTQATLSIYGNIFMWVGMWQLVSAPRGLVAYPDVMDALCSAGNRFCFLYNLGYLRNVLYYSLGAILIFCTGTWYGNASVYGTYVPWWISRYPIFIFWQVCVGYIGMLLAWVGIYNSLGNWIAVNFPDYNAGIWANAVIFFLGMKLVILTQTWTCLAYVYPEGYFDNPPLSSLDPWHEHAFQMVRSAVSYFGQIAMWVTSWNLMLNYFGDDGTSIYTSMIWMGFGLALLFATRTYLLTAWLDMLDDDYDDDDPGTVLFYVRVTFSITGQFMNNTGFWNILESYVTPSGTVTTNSAYGVQNVPQAFIMVAISVVMLWLAGILQVGCGVNPIDMRELRTTVSNIKATGSSLNSVSPDMPPRLSTLRRRRTATSPDPASDPLRERLISGGHSDA